MNILTINQGEFQVSSDPDVRFETVLGSCIAVCIRNTRNRKGGMNHFLLPRRVAKHTSNNSSLIYGTYSIERLINALLDPKSIKSDLEVKVFGGAQMLGENLNVGEVNAHFVEGYFAKEGMKIVASDLRGEWARKINFAPTTGKAFVATLKRVPLKDVLESELRAHQSLNSRIPYGSLEMLR